MASHPVPPVPELVEGRPVRYLDAVPGQLRVHVHLGVPYAQRSGRDLHLQIIQPSVDTTFAQADQTGGTGDRESYPCVVFVQGSGWGEQALGSSIAFWCRFAERGFVVAIVEYRPSSVAPFPAQVADAKTAVRWLRNHADAYGIDPAQVVLAGDSSGGHTVLMAHVTDGLLALDDDPDGGHLGIRAVVDLYGITDFTLLERELLDRGAAEPDWLSRRALGGLDPATHAATLRGAEPATWLDRGRPLLPLLMVHGTADGSVPLSQSEAYLAALREHGHDAELVVVRGGKHGLWPALYNDALADLLEEFIRRAVGT